MGEQPQLRYSVRVSYVQVYNETISDLLVPSATNLNIQSTPNGVVIEGLSEHEAVSEKQVLQLLRRGRRNRFTAATELNELSSRSHAVFLLNIQQHETFYLSADGDCMRFPSDESVLTARVCSIVDTASCSESP